ncbi:replication restart helicase PriA [Sulfobacillus thermosulfidooxidans]|uniref:replication restart helicase PriA n=1 Tax=Sulfobacillus thermosulfidooxidans TaxID=28034 RepID=UPI0006B4311D|nr:primosomal protein N' [Sulfobacillus thermosulfidooxidans]
MKVAHVIIDRTARGLDRAWTYMVPEGMDIRVGHRIRVPFGKGETLGIVTAVDEYAKPDSAVEVALKPVLNVVDPVPVLSPVMIELGMWMAEEYLCFPIQAYKAMLPRNIRLRSFSAAKQEFCQAVGQRQGRPSKRQHLWDVLAERGPILKEDLLKEMPEMRPVLRDLVKEGTVVITRLDTASPSAPMVNGQESPLTLNQEQMHAVTTIVEAPPGSKWLLEGITGSGKTEVYLQIIETIVQHGQQALVLVPEIALTPQTVRRFQSRFGQAVGLWHSSLTDSERAKTWQAVRDGQLAIVVGVRSAIFLPFRNLGLIVLDEEHESTYKQEEHPRYHTRDVAFWLAEKIGAKVVLGSATPSLETAFYARQGLIGWIRLTRRIGTRSLPPVEIIDMREELQEGNHSIFSRALQQALTKALDRGEQGILFLNRRGYASFVMCRDCGQAVQCPHCSVTLTYHQDQNQLMCHYCFYTVNPPTVCPHCGSRRIRYFGAGTERIVEEVMKLWPGTRVLRADRDTLSSRHSYYQLYDDFVNRRADVLVGTQMIAKGMDFPHVSVVGIVAADVALHLPDFRRSERTFQLLVQASGRTGRGDLPGIVIVQAYEPEHFAIQSAATHGYDDFYNQEIQYRRELGYPPFGNLWLLEVADASEQKAKETIERIFEKVTELMNMGIEVLGPAPAPLPKMRGRFRYHILLKGAKNPRIMAMLTEIERDELSCSITVDPYYML